MTPGGGERHEPPRAAGRSRRPPAGLCDTCVHQRLVGNTRGSEFSLCRRSVDEPDRYPKYPRLPVLACGGWQGAGPATAGV